MNKPSFVNNDLYNKPIRGITQIRKTKIKLVAKNVILKKYFNVSFSLGRFSNNFCEEVLIGDSDLELKII